MSSSRPTVAEITAAIRTVADFPKPGIQFKDITPVLGDARLFAGAIELLTEKFLPGSVDAVVGIDARGFIFAAAAAMRLHAGFVPVRGQKLSAAEKAETASLLQPEGIYGPSFLATPNYFVIKEYNFSDLYVLFVGHLSARMTSPLPFATPWSASTQLRTTDVEAMQEGLTRIGLYKDKIDGKAGMLTRAALGAYQKSAGLKVDCWPSEAVLQSINAKH